MRYADPYTLGTSDITLIKFASVAVLCRYKTALELFLFYRSTGLGRILVISELNFS